MVNQEVVGSTRTIQWKCVESRIDSKCLNYGRFILSPLKKGQADTIGIAMRRALLGEILGTSITRATFKKVKVSHEYSRIVGIEEPVHEILLNLKQIVLRNFTNGVIKASICVSGPTRVTAKDISLPPFVQIIDTTQYIATLTEPIDFSIELQIERDRGYRVKHTNNLQDQDGSYPIDAVSMPVRTVNYTIHNCRNGNEDEEILFLEIWTNGSLTPREALRDASINLIGLFIPFLHPEEGDICLKEKKNTFTLLPLSFKDRVSELKFWEEIEELKKYTDKKIKELDKLRKKNKKIEIPWDCLFIDQLRLSSRTYNCLKKSNINTMLDIMNTRAEDFFQIKDFRTKEFVEITLLIAQMIDFLVILYKNKRST
uniref:DNA-directed RNA polymerase subunit alpha n=1 Tax=Cyperus fuscus TaxID=529431 RepID=A0A6H0EWX3_9POAL|nr:RNA polymerase alpha subunit [Cyperus fuscus]